jgi:hypothetical protein
MKKFLFYGFLMLFISCDDGDLQIETLDFDSVTIQNCDAITVDIANVLFKLNATEALILELPAGSIKNEVSEGVKEYSVASSGPTKVSYRTFSDTVSNNYFCSNIPLTTPDVVEEIIAQGGSIFITTVLNADGVTYEHTIELSSISLVTSNDTRITDLSINNFGTVTTILSE